MTRISPGQRHRQQRRLHRRLERHCGVGRSTPNVPARSQRPAANRARTTGSPKHGRRLFLLARAPRPRQARDSGPAQSLPLPRRRVQLVDDARRRHARSTACRSPRRRPCRVPHRFEADRVRQRGLSADVHLRRRRPGSIRCASCNPQRPAARRSTSRRARAAVHVRRRPGLLRDPDSLVPRDTNGSIIDVYEYVDGRPQLITSGTGRRDFTGGGSRELPHPGDSPASRRSAATAPTSTSRPSTRSSTKTQNGEFVKFYDARTGGGFPPSAPRALRGGRRVPRARQPRRPPPADRRPATELRHRRQRRDRRSKKKKKKGEEEEGQAQKQERQAARGAEQWLIAERRGDER